MHSTQLDSAPARSMMCPSGAGKRLSDNQIVNSGRMSAPEECCEQKKLASCFARRVQPTNQFGIRSAERGLLLPARNSQVPDPQLGTLNFEL